MADFGQFRGFGDKLFQGQLPTELGLIGSISSVVPFQFTVDTTQSGVSASNQFKLPLITSTGLDCVVDWGDGTSDNITNHLASEVTHTYPSSGTYTIRIIGELLGFYFNNGGDKLKMGEIQKWGVLNIDFDKSFYGCTNMTCIATDAPKITTTNLRQTFRSCSNFNGAIGNWDVSNVSNMSLMLYIASSFDQDISNWDISQVADFTSFMSSVTLSTTNYNILLVGWETNLQSVYPSGLGYPYTISINFGSSKYTSGSAAATARQSLIDNFNWTITDGGTV